jgi:hypothetical protein
MSVVVDIAEAVKDSLNAATLSQAFTAERAYVPVRELDQMGSTLFVTVVPRDLSMVTLSRRDDDFDYVVDVAIQKRLTRGETTREQVNAECDALMTLVEEIADLFRSVMVLASIPARFMGLSNPPIYSPDHLDGDRVFTSVLRLRFKRARSR